MVGDLLGTLEGKDAQLVLSYIARPEEAPDPRFVDEWRRRCARCAATDLDMTTPVKTLVLGGAGEQEASEAARLKADAISTEAPGS